MFGRRQVAEVAGITAAQVRGAVRLHAGAWPGPEKTPPVATVTGSIRGDGFVVDMIHYQSRPRLYVTGNLYRPSKVEAGRRFPAAFYVCSNQGRSGNKTACQSHGIRFARHGYVCLTVDTLQLGFIMAPIAKVAGGGIREVIRRQAWNVGTGSAA